MNRRTRIIADYAYITAGSAITAFSTVAFLNPARLAPGGVSGIATILFHTLGWDLGTTIAVLTVPIFLLGVRLFGRQYGAKTLAGSILLSVFTWIWTAAIGTDGIISSTSDVSTWLSALFGGVSAGIGMGIAMKSGSNTGGTDIIAQILARYTPMTLGTSLFAVDGVIIAASAFFFGLENALYAIVVAYLTTAAINKIVLSMGTNYAKTVFIISSQYESIGSFIMESMERGATLLDAQGFYTKEPRPMLMTVVPNQYISRLSRAVQERDPDAFMIVQDTYHVIGEGYSEIGKLSDTGDVTQH